MELPPCPSCGGEPDAPCRDCGRAPIIVMVRSLPSFGSREWRRVRARLATGDTTPLQIARCYGRDIEDTIAWLYPGLERGRPLELAD